MNRGALGLVVAATALVGLIAGCAGEVTRLEVGERGDDLDRFRTEIQPILQHPAANVDGGVARNCAQAGCHAALIGNLQIIADPTEDELRENYRLVGAKVDAANPTASILLTDPLCGTSSTLPVCAGSSHPVSSFTGTDDCCYTTLLAWISGEDSPMCGCP